MYLYLYLSQIQQREQNEKRKKELIKKLSNPIKLDILQMPILKYHTPIYSFQKRYIKITK